MGTDMENVKIFTCAELFNPNFTQKCVNYAKCTITTKQHKFCEQIIIYNLQFTVDKITLSKLTQSLTIGKVTLGKLTPNTIFTKFTMV